MFRTAAPATIVVDKVKKSGVWSFDSKPVLAHWRDRGRQSILIYLDLAPAGTSQLEYIRSEVATEVAKAHGGSTPRVELSVKAARKWR